MKAFLAPLALLASGAAHAHDGHVHWLEAGATWTWDPWVTVPLAVSGGLYLCGAHMVEHEILMTAAAPLLVLSRPVAMLWALPTAARRSIGGLGQVPAVSRWWARLTNPLVATLLHGGALWAWHAPALYQAALADPWIHWLQHLCFFGTALLFWRALLQGRERERAYGAAVFYLFATSLHTGFLGVLLAFARRPIYPAQTAGAAEWGLTPLEDQQLAGLFMWIPAGLVYAGAALALAGLWIARSGSPRRNGYHAAAAR